MESLLDEFLELDDKHSYYQSDIWQDTDEIEDFDTVSPPPPATTMAWITFLGSSGLTQLKTEEDEFSDIDCLSDDAHTDTSEIFDLIDQDMFIETQTSLEDESQSYLEDINSTQRSAIPEVIDHFEDFVLGFLNQVLDALPHPSGTNHGKIDSENEPPSYSQTEYYKGLKLKRKKIEITLANRRKEPTLEDTQWFSSFSKSFWRRNKDSLKHISYPKKCTQGSLKPFAQIFRLLEISHRASIGNVPTTKRDAFYQDVALFGSQRVVDTFVDDLAATFDVERSELHIRSSSKGLICGSSLRIKLLSGEEIECKDTESTLIPAGEDIETFSVDEKLSWVLVVEKEAVFQTLVKLGVTTSATMPGNGILITGKGYPDVSTRHLVKSLADALPRSIPICGIVDADPYGLDILSVYKFGSRAMRHENDRLAAGRIRWLGVCASELSGYGIDRDALLPLSLRDQNKILFLLKRSDLSLPKKWRKELQRMLFTRRKAEIEVLCSNKFQCDQSWQNPQVTLIPSVPQPAEGKSGSAYSRSARDCYELLLQYISQRLSHLIDKTGEQREVTEPQPSSGGMEILASTSRTDEDDEFIEQEFDWEGQNINIETEVNGEVEWSDTDMVVQ